MLTRHGDFIMLGGKFPRLAKKQAGTRLKEIKKLLLGCNFTSFLIEHPEIVPIPVAVGQFQGRQGDPGLVAARTDRSVCSGTGHPAACLCCGRSCYRNSAQKGIFSSSSDTPFPAH